jgi:hypothetical protein
VDAPTTACFPATPPRARALFWSPHPPTHSLPSLSCALNRTPSLSLSLSHCAHAHEAPPWSVVRSVAAVELLPHPLPRLAPPPREQRETPSGLPLAPLFHSVRAHRLLHLAAGAPPPSTQGLPASPPLLKRSRVPSRGEKTPHALNFPCTTLSSAQLLTGASLRCRYATSPQTDTMVPLRRCRAHDRFRRVIPNLPVPLQASQDPWHGRARVSGEVLSRSQAAPPLAARKGDQGWPSVLRRLS